MKGVNHMIGGLIIGWILSLFGFDDLFIKGFGEMFGRDITIAGYYVCFFLIGAICDMLESITGGKT